MYPIIYIISPPRTRSTILFRALDAQSIFTTFHEPSIAPHDKIKYPGLTSDWFHPYSFKDFKEIQNAILTESEKNYVLVKDISFSFVKHLDSLNFISESNIYFYFLIRNPLETMSSYYEKVKNMNSPAIWDNYLNLNGFNCLDHIYNIILKNAKNKPKIILNEEFSNPGMLLASILEPLDLNNTIKLKWDDLGGEFDGKRWNEQKKKDFFIIWHHSAIRSKEIIWKESNIKNVDDLMSSVYDIHKNIVLSTLKKNFEVFLIRENYYLKKSSH